MGTTTNVSPFLTVIIVGIAILFVAPALMFGAALAAGEAKADGLAKPWQMWFQEPASPVMERIVEFHDLVFAIEVAIVFLVLGILAYIIVRFNAKANPAPSKNTHNTLLEVIWTVIPVLILIVIAVPSMKLLSYADKIEKADMTLKVTSHQWYWSYEYPDQGGIAFDSFIVPDEELKPGQPRLLAVDEPAVLPVDTTIRVLVTSSDVLHGFAVPALGVKIDTIPGRLNETWTRINKPGMYYGQCSELCGVNHAFMPIGIKAVPKDEFAAWVKRMADKLAARADAGVVAAEQSQR